MRKALGRHVVVDTKICHGQPTFRGPRILVSDVLEQVADGMAWEDIEDQWRGAVNQKAIAKAVRLAFSPCLRRPRSGSIPTVKRSTMTDRQRQPRCRIEGI